jgi:hypothetical protein
MELVDMQDLGSCAERRVGSSPFIRTTAAACSNDAGGFYHVYGNKDGTFQSLCAGSSQGNPAGRKRQKS